MRNYTLSMHLRRPVIQVGNSFAIRLTKAEARKMGIGKGDIVEADVTPAGKGLRIDPKYFFHDGRGAIDIDYEVGAQVAEELARGDGR